MRTELARRLLPLALMVATPVLATDGYFSIGYGLIQVGHGGAGHCASARWTGGCDEPGGNCFRGGPIRFRRDLVSPIRSGSITGSGAPGVDGEYDASRKKSFFIPELGYNHLLNPRVAVGIAMYGNGGMDTAYTTPIPLLGSRLAGVDLVQLFVAPTVAFKANDHNAFGVSLNIGYQRFSASGLQNFANPQFSSAPNNVTDLYGSGAFGGGVRVGWLGTINKTLSVGATYQSRTWMQKFDKYQGLFAEQAGSTFPRILLAAWR